MELIQRGDVGEEVADVQRRLESVGLDCDDEPGVFGDATHEAVRTFQQRRGLTADGIVGEDTWLVLVGAGYELGDRLLTDTRPMMRGDDVRELQRRLNQLGFDAGYDDGIYGPETAGAVREFQLNTGLRADGIAGPGTVQALRVVHRQHQQAPAFAVRERESLRDGGRPSVAGARLLLDPRRGPDSPGLRAPDGVREHELTWAITNRLAGRLSALGVNVVLARGPNTTPTASQRAALANHEEVEATLAIGLNGLASSREARGAAAYYFGRERYVSERGRVLAQLAVDNIVARTGSANCRTHRSAAALLRESRAPAVIVEPGFLTHPVEGLQLTRPDYQRLIAEALVDAVVTFMLGGLPQGGRPTPASSALVGSTLAS